MNRKCNCNEVREWCLAAVKVLHLVWEGGVFRGRPGGSPADRWRRLVILLSADSLLTSVPERVVFGRSWLQVTDSGSRSSGVWVWRHSYSPLICSCLPCIAGTTEQEVSLEVSEACELALGMRRNRREDDRQRLTYISGCSMPEEGFPTCHISFFKSLNGKTDIKCLCYIQYRKSVFWSRCKGPAAGFGSTIDKKTKFSMIPVFSALGPTLIKGYLKNKYR